MAPENDDATRLGHRLAQLRKAAGLTQAQLAAALSAEDKVAPATVSAYESGTKTPPPTRLSTYARFFATDRSLEGRPHLIPATELHDDELARLEELEVELLALHTGISRGGPTEPTRRILLAFNEPGPIVIICPEAPKPWQGKLADESDINHTKLHRYGDADALIEVFGHIRALNPKTQVLHRLPSTVQSPDLQNHVVVLGGIGWNLTVRRIQAAVKTLPVEQFEDDRLKTGEVFRVKEEADGEERVFFPVMEEGEGSVRQLVEDVALVARLPNPFNVGRTLTICNGVHSRGVIGAVLTLTDETLRQANEEYLARRFPTGSLAVLVRVPVVSGQVLAPDLQNPETRLFEWPSDGATGPRK